MINCIGDVAIQFESISNWNVSVVSVMTLGHRITRDEPKDLKWRIRIAMVAAN